VDRSAYSIRSGENKPPKPVQIGQKVDDVRRQKLIGQKSEIAKQKKLSEERVLRMKLKPTRPKETFEDQPKMKKGPNWRKRQAEQNHRKRGAR